MSKQQGEMESLQKNRHKKIRCKVCAKVIRSDHAKRNARTHKDILCMNDDEVREELRARNEVRIKREERVQELMEIAQQENISIELNPELTIDTVVLREDLFRNNQEYLYQIELGKQIFNIIDEGVVREESLTSDKRKALMLYRKTKPTIDIKDVHLRPWQQTLTKMISTPTERTVFWIIGSKGNEGKSWFQGYLETFYGYARVVRLELSNTSSNILHALSKRPLSTTDIFLFNDTRGTSDVSQNYSILENIKDGCAISTKYNSEIIKFKTPNTVVVFTNNKPDTSRLSSDRWRVYSINKDDLNCKYE